MSTFKKHILFTKKKTIVNLCEPLRKFGILGFIYIRRFPDGRFFDLSNQVEWSEYFIERYLSGIYPVDSLLDHLFLSEGLSLWDLNPDNIIWQEGKHLFGFGHGISMVHQHAHYEELFCFYGQKDHAFINDFYLKSLNFLEKFCHYFSEKANVMIAADKLNPLHTPEKYLHQHNMRNKPVEINSRLGVSNHSFERLTIREKECIQLIARGLFTKAVADTLCISPRTVETHLNNAKIKLQCVTLPQLIYTYYQQYESFF